MSASATRLRPGDEIPPISKLVTKETILAYADASGDHNPLHVDDAFAATTRYGGVIAHGMFSLALLSQAMDRGLGSGWRTGGGLRVAFLKPVRPGDEVTARGKVEECETDGSGTRIDCTVEVVNQKSEVVIVGRAWGRLAPAANDVESENA